MRRTEEEGKYGANEVKEEKKKMERIYRKKENEREKTKTNKKERKRKTKQKKKKGRRKSQENKTSPSPRHAQPRPPRESVTSRTKHYQPVTRIPGV